MVLLLRTSYRDLLIQSDFSEPAFNLFSDPVNLQRQLLGKLSHYGLQLRDIRWDQGTGTLGDLNLFCNLSAFAVTLRIRLERVEILCSDLTPRNEQGVNGIALDVLSLLETAELGMSFKTHLMAASFHGVLENSSVSLSKAGPSKDFIDQFVTQPPKDLGPHVGNGVVYYFGPQEHRLSAAVTFDLSVRIPDGLYVRLQAAWDGQSVHAQDLPAVFGNYLRVVYADFGLEWKR